MRSWGAAYEQRREIRLLAEGGSPAESEVYGIDTSFPRSVKPLIKLVIPVGRLRPTADELRADLT